MSGKRRVEDEGVRDRGIGGEGATETDKEGRKG
jgi:hypothetical protein